MLTTHRPLLIVSLLVVAASFTVCECRAALPTTTGSERNLWDQDGYAVVLARVEEIAELSREESLKKHASHVANRTKRDDRTKRDGSNIHRFINFF